MGCGQGKGQEVGTKQKESMPGECEHEQKALIVNYTTVTKDIAQGRMTRRKSTENLLQRGPLPPGMYAVFVDRPFVEASLDELDRLSASKVFVVANKKSAEAAQPLIDALTEQKKLCAPLCCSVIMGCEEEGLMEACNAASKAQADAVVSIGGGAIQDAGKLIRMWLSAADEEGASVAKIQAAAKRDPMPALPPGLALPNSFAMAELTHIAGLNTKEKVKSGAAHKSMMPTTVIYDSVLARDVPDWVRFGTALRGVEHSVGAVCSPTANDEIRELALIGMRMVYRGLVKMVQDPQSGEAQADCYTGGWHSIRALNTGCYPALGHLIENHYSARFDVHQGSCSGILCARMMNYHKEISQPQQDGLAAAMDRPGESATKLISDLVATLPGVSKDHGEGVDLAKLKDFAAFLFDKHGERLNQLSPKPFSSAADIESMLTQPIGSF